MYSDDFTRFGSATLAPPLPKEVNRYPCEQDSNADRAVPRIFVDRARSDQPFRRDEQNYYCRVDSKRGTGSLDVSVCARCFSPKTKQAHGGHAEEQRINRDHIVEYLFV